MWFVVENNHRNAIGNGLVEKSIENEFGCYPLLYCFSFGFQGDDKCQVIRECVGLLFEFGCYFRIVGQIEKIEAPFCLERKKSGVRKTQIKVVCFK